MIESGWDCGHVDDETYNSRLRCCAYCNPGLGGDSSTVDAIRLRVMQQLVALWPEHMTAQTGSGFQWGQLVATAAVAAVDIPRIRSKERASTLREVEAWLKKAESQQVGFINAPWVAQAFAAHFNPEVE